MLLPNATVIVALLAMGAIVGVISGIVGIGGGILITPILMKWHSLLHPYCEGFPPRPASLWPQGSFIIFTSSSAPREVGPTLA